MSRLRCREWSKLKGHSLIVEDFPCEDGRGNGRSILNELAVDVKAYRHADIQFNDESRWLVTVDTNVISVTLLLEDIYGNDAVSLMLCSDYPHNRIEIYTWFTASDSGVRVYPDYQQTIDFDVSDSKLR